MWLITLGILLALAWVAGVFIFHVAGWLIHLLIVIAVITLLIRIIRGK